MSFFTDELMKCTEGFEFISTHLKLSNAVSK